MARAPKTNEYEEEFRPWIRHKPLISGFYTDHNIIIGTILSAARERELCDSRNNCVLITTGSLNPIHRSHINNMELVKSHLEQKNWNVLAGYLSPSHDSYVRQKLRQNTIDKDLRCDLCNRAIREHRRETNTPAWLHVSRAEVDYKDGFVDFAPTTIALRDHLNSTLFSYKFIKHPINVFYVCGLDHFNKCGEVTDLAQQDYVRCAVIYRKSSDEAFISVFEGSQDIFYVPLQHNRDDLEDISSTEIRRQWNRSDTQLRMLTYDSVIRRLKDSGFKFT